MNASPDPGWEVLLTSVGRTLLREISALLDHGDSPDRVNATLRKRGEAPEVVAALLTQTQLRIKAEQKFGSAARDMLFTRAGLEQATRAIVAREHAARFSRAGASHVADLGCGIGAESRAFVAAGLNVRAVEIDPLTAHFADHNLAQCGADTQFDVLLGDAESLGVGEADAAFLDPARRTAGHRDTKRRTAPSDYTPPLSFAFDLATKLPTGIKLGPGFDRELIPSAAEAQWISVNGQVVETGLWFGACARSGVKRAALVIFARSPALEDAVFHELTAPNDAADPEVREPGEFLIEPDGAVIRARLIGQLADDLGAGLMSNQIAYLTSDQNIPTPFAQRFRLIEELPFREKDLRRALIARDIGPLEIKKRGADIDPATLRKRLRLTGSHSATLIFTRSNNRHVAYLAERLSS